MAQASFTLNSTVTPYKIPLSAILLWPNANLTNPERRTWLLPYAVCLEILASVIISARIYARVKGLAGKFGFDDILIIAAWFCGVVFTIFALWGITHPGFDRHIWDLPIRFEVQNGFLSWACLISFHIASTLTKISILLFYRRLLARTLSRRIQWTIHIAISLTIVYFFVFLIILIFTCVPTSASWTGMNVFSKKIYTCRSRRIQDIMVGVFSMLSDVYALAIPNVVVSRMQLSRPQKLMLYAVFSCGSITIIASIARTYWLAWLHYDPVHDLTWTGFNVLVWSLLELHSAMICASAPAVKGLFVAGITRLSIKLGKGKSSISISDDQPTEDARETTEKTSAVLVTVNTVQKYEC